MDLSSPSVGLQSRAVCMADAARRIQVVGHGGLDGRVVLHRGHGHRPGGRGQPDVLTRARAQGAARAVLTHERAVLVVDIGVAQALGLAGGGAGGGAGPQAGEERHEAGARLRGGRRIDGLGLEDALAQRVVGVAGGRAGRRGAGGDAAQTAGGVVGISIARSGARR